MNPMKQQQGRFDLFLNRYFIAGILLLALNDWWLKQEFHNIITGKLSDMAGLFAFPFFLAVLFPRLKQKTAIITALIFIVWKTPLVTPFITWFNTLGFFRMSRVIDYSDYFTLPVVMVSHCFINNTNTKMPSVIMLHNRMQRTIKLVMLLLSSFIFGATSFHMRETPKGTVFIGETYTFEMKLDTVLSRLTQSGYH